jgi:hypothetical protein
MEQLSLFAPEPGLVPAKRPGEQPEQMTVMITVKAAPNPSERYGETVCIAGIRLDLEKAGWVRLYPVNFRELNSDLKFRKYDVVTLDARPTRDDPRGESWRPLVDTVTTVRHLNGWARRWPYLADHVADSMCGLLQAVRDDPRARSLAAIRPRKVLDLDIEPHPGWTRDEQAKIDKYVSQVELPGMSRVPKTPLEAPRFKGWYRYLCQAAGCRGHRQSVIDWEWVALQRHLADRDDAAACRELRTRFLNKICAPENDLLLYVGNQAKRPQGFMVLGAFYPRR